VPRLIINADDFGLTPGVNRGIVRAARTRGVFSATIMAGSKSFSEAIALAKETPQLKTGCHVVLIDGQPVGENVPSLVGNTGRFRSSVKDFGRAALRNEIAAEDVRREAEAQIRKIQSQGITLTHVDTHKHTHVLPHILIPLLQAAKACGIHAVRNPFEPFRSWPLSRVMATPGSWARAAGVAGFRAFSAASRHAIQKEGMLTTDGSVGMMATGFLDQKMLTAILRALPEGTWELVCHPGYADGDLKGAGTRLVESRQVELEALTSEETRKVIEERGIELISYANLKPS
jgi:hopanoid biosynthesis associated protein HpnK